MDLDYLFTRTSGLETDRLFFRALTAEDADDYFLLASDPKVTTHTIWPRHERLSDTHTYLKRVEEQNVLRHSYHWGIVLKSSGRLIGRIGIINVDGDHEKAELGYALASEFWGQGFITEAGRRVVSFLFTEVGVHRLEARCSEHNPGSYRVMEKLGMTFEGLLREQLRIQGYFVNQRMYAMLQSDYNNASYR
ncbi:GNAT family N-acetyltransferase [Paenibacillus daejeonensis]|uniref:GNAT family N-acetyltransferase n=1 Tax=Paenibacillus daejeonensis TaxID=135193 RepID=UPI00037D2928|nr:GNAT family N-acetyltransferase [Paenibacillus daejeonensis]